MIIYIFERLRFFNLSWTSCKSGANNTPQWREKIEL